MDSAEVGEEFGEHFVGLGRRIWRGSLGGVDLKEELGIGGVEVKTWMVSYNTSLLI